MTSVLVAGAGLNTAGQYSWYNPEMQSSNPCDVINQYTQEPIFSARFQPGLYFGQKLLGKKAYFGHSSVEKASF